MIKNKTLFILTIILFSREVYGAISLSSDLLPCVCDLQVIENSETTVTTGILTFASSDKEKIAKLESTIQQRITNDETFFYTLTNSETFALINKKKQTIYPNGLLTLSFRDQQTEQVYEQHKLSIEEEMIFTLDNYLNSIHQEKKSGKKPSCRCDIKNSPLPFACLLSNVEKISDLETNVVRVTFYFYLREKINLEKVFPSGQHLLDGFVMKEGSMIIKKRPAGKNPPTFSLLFSLNSREQFSNFYAHYEHIQKIMSYKLDKALTARTIPRKHTLPLPSLLQEKEVPNKKHAPDNT